jgi:hypothetical protein
MSIGTRGTEANTEKDANGDYTANEQREGQKTAKHREREANGGLKGRKRGPLEKGKRPQQNDNSRGQANDASPYAFFGSQNHHVLSKDSFNVHQLISFNNLFR